METIQVAIANAPYAAALREVLLQSGAWDVVCVEVPDTERDGVVVVDCEHLKRLPRPLPNPDRVVLIARNEPGDLKRAWEAGVSSLVFDKDPLNTAVLAIMAARLNRSRPRPRPPAGERLNGGLGGPPGAPSY